jgi:hypothetical protein
MPEEIGKWRLRKAGFVGILWHRVEERGLRVCLPAGTDMAVEVSRGGVKELLKWSKENIGGDRKGAEEFLGEETGSVSFVG